MRAFMTETALSEQVVDGFKHAAERIASGWQTSGKKLLRLEGFMGIGKSGIASLIAESSPNARVIGTDEFATPDAKSNDISERLDQMALRVAARAAIAESDLVIFEGVCLEELLPPGQFGAGFRVYIKHVSLPSADCILWHDGLNLDAPDYPANWLDQQILDYHRIWRPHERADLCLAIPEARY